MCTESSSQSYELYLCCFSTDQIVLLVILIVLVIFIILIIFEIFAGLVVIFLHVHPFGASMDYIWSYLKRGGIDIKSSHLETLLDLFPNMFSVRLCGVGVNFEKRWLFTGFPDGV